MTGSALSKTLVLVVLVFASCCRACPTSPELSQSLESTTVLFGNEHTFECEATRVDYGWWRIDHRASKDLSEDCARNSYQTTNQTACTVNSNLTIQSSCMPVYEDIQVECHFLSYYSWKTVNSTAFLRVLAIDRVTEVCLTKNGLQWKPSEVRLGNSSNVFYNISVTNSSAQLLISATTGNASFPINSSQLMQCNNYNITILPFRSSSSGIEEGFPTQVLKEYPGELPVADNISVLVTRDSIVANITIKFTVQFPSSNCTSNKPQNSQVVSEGVSYPEQTVNDGLNEYSLEHMGIKKRWTFNIVLKNGDESSTSLSKAFSVSTFQVQDLKLKFTADTFQLHVTCVNVLGMNNTCSIKVVDVKSEAEICCNESASTTFLCQLPNVSGMQFLVLAYDEDFPSEPAVTKTFVTFKVDDSTDDASETEGTESDSDGPNRGFVSEVSDPSSFALFIIGRIIVIVMVSLSGCVGIVAVVHTCIRCRRQHQSDLSFEPRRHFTKLGWLFSDTSMQFGTKQGVREGFDGACCKSGTVPT